MTYSALRWFDVLPSKNAEWGPFSFYALCAIWIAFGGIGVAGFYAPDFIAHNLYRLEQPIQFRFSLRTMLIATTLSAALLGLGVWLER